MRRRRQRRRYVHRNQDGDRIDDAVIDADEHADPSGSLAEFHAKPHSNEIADEDLVRNRHADITPECHTQRLTHRHRDAQQHSHADAQPVANQHTGCHSDGISDAARDRLLDTDRHSQRITHGYTIGIAHIRFHPHRHDNQIANRHACGHRHAFTQRYGNRVLKSDANTCCHGIADQHVGGVGHRNRVSDTDAAPDTDRHCLGDRDTDAHINPDADRHAIRDCNAPAQRDPKCIGNQSSEEPDLNRDLDSGPESDAVTQRLSVADRFQERDNDTHANADTNSYIQPIGNSHGN